MPDIMFKPPDPVETRTPTPRCDVLDQDDPSIEPPLREPVYPPGFEGEDLQRLQLGIIQHCEKMKDRFAILDPASNLPSRRTN